MSGSFRCFDPLDSVVRVMDTARRMNIRFSHLKFEKADNASFVLTFSLDENDSQKLNTFSQRIGLQHDLIEEIVDV